MRLVANNCLLGLAGGAHTGELVKSACQAITMLGRHLPLQHLERLELELHNLLAPAADQVVVMLLPERRLVPPLFS